MEKITKKDIDLLAEYFSSGGIGSQNVEALKDFASALNAIFITQPFNEVVFNNFLSENDATDFKNEILTIKNDYEFQTDIQQSFKQLEREKLKKKFLAIDKDEAENNLSDKEILVAFQQIERENLKAKFKAIDNEENIIVPTARKFNFRPWAIAASVALICTIGALFFINNQKIAEQLAKNEPKKTQKSLIDFSNILSDNHLKIIKKDLPINDLGQMGFASKSIHFENYILQSHIDTLQKIVVYLKENKADLKQLNTIEKSLDSLNNLNFKYTFTGNKLKLYSFKAVKAEIFQDNDKLSVSIQNKDYPFKETKTLKSLK